MVHVVEELTPIIIHYVYTDVVFPWNCTGVGSNVSVILKTNYCYIALVNIAKIIINICVNLKTV